MVNNVKDYIEVTLETRAKDDHEKIIRTETKSIRSNIFRKDSHGTDEKDTSRFVFWLRMKLLFLLDLTFPDKRRFFRIHYVLKHWLLYPAFKIIMKVIGKSLVTEDSQIPPYWYNNHIRLFRWCLKESFDDIWRIQIAMQKAKTREMVGDRFNAESKIRLDGVRSRKGMSCNKARHLAADIWITEMLEDTVDREQCNFLCSRIFHEMAWLYGVDINEAMKVPVPGKFPVYVSKTQYDPQYFISGANYPVWIYPESRNKVKEEDNNGKDKNKKNKRINKNK